MSILDDLDKKISNISVGAIQKTKEVSEQLKITKLIKETENNIYQLYAKIGELYYKDASENQLYELCQTIRNLESDLDEYNKILSRLKGTAICSTCGAEIPSGSVFCIKCGNKVENVISNNAMCPSCGALVKIGASFCNKCGFQFSLKNNQDMLLNDRIQEFPQPIKKVEYFSNKKNCVYCGALIVSDNKFCVSCGKMIVSEESEINVCPQCGKVLKPNQIFCTGCGHKMEY